MTSKLSPDPRACESDHFAALLKDIRRCRICLDAPRYGPPLPHEPRPIVQLAESARICIASQAPGIRAHRSGRPFDDPSGARLRQWLGVDEHEFYDASRIAILPMGFCFPGQGKSGDLPPRRECAELWRSRVLAQLTHVRLLVVIGSYALRWQLGPVVAKAGLTETVRAWRHYRNGANPPIIPLPHPSWHNNRWLSANPWFDAELLPELRADVRAILDS